GRLVRWLAAQRWRGHGHAAHAAACGVADALVDDFAVGLVLALGLDPAAVGVGLAPAGGWLAGMVPPSAEAEAQLAASGASGCGPGLSPAGTLILPLLLLAATTSAW